MDKKIKRHYTKWTLEENELLEKLHEKKLKVNDIADFFPDKTDKQVRAKYDYMFSKKKKNTNPSRRWTTKELRILEDNYNIEWTELCNLLPKRSEISIKHTLNRRGLKRQRLKVTEEVEKNILKLIISHSVSEVASQLRLSKQSVYNVLKKHRKSSLRFAWVLKNAEMKQEGSEFSVTFTILKEKTGDYID